MPSKRVFKVFAEAATHAKRIAKRLGEPVDVVCGSAGWSISIPSYTDANETWIDALIRGDVTVDDDDNSGEFDDYARLESFDTERDLIEQELRDDEDSHWRSVDEGWAAED